MSEKRIEIVREYNFDPKEVIKGLNGYYESDKRNGYITVGRRSDFEGPAYLTAALYLSALIEWLREDHDIFYRPGLILDQVEAARSAAKMCCLRAHIKDEICKRGLWCDKDADIPALVDTLFKAYDECGKARDRNRKDAVKLSEVTRELRKEVNALKDTGIYCSKSYISDRIHEICSAKKVELDDAFLYDDDYTWEDLVGFLCEEIRKLKKEVEDATETNCKYIMNYIRQEASRNGFNLPEEIDGEPLTIKRVFHDLLELMRKRDTEARNARKAVNDQLKKDTDYAADTLCDILEVLGISKSNTAHLDIPGLKTRALQRASVIKSEHDRYQEQLGKATADYQALSEENQKLKMELRVLKDTVSGVRARLNSKFIPLPGYEKDLEKLADIALRAVEARDETINRIKEVRAKEVKQECYWYLWNALKKLSPDCDALKIDRYEDLVDRIFYEMSFVDANCKRCRKEHTTEKFDYIQRTNKAEEEVKKLKEQKDRAAAILQDLYRDIFHKDCTQFTYEAIATKILDKVLKTEALLHLESVDNYKLGLKDYILKDIRKRGYRYDGLETKPIEDIVDWIITMATCPRNEWVDWRVENLRSQITRLKDLINAMNEEVKDM